MRLEQEIGKLEDYVLKIDSPELDAIYLNILSAFSELTTQLDALVSENKQLSEDLEERKEIMWNNPIFRESILSQVRHVLGH